MAERQLTELQQRILDVLGDHEWPVENIAKAAQISDRAAIGSIRDLVRDGIVNKRKHDKDDETYFYSRAKGADQINHVPISGYSVRLDNLILNGLLDLEYTSIVFYTAAGDSFEQKLRNRTSLTSEVKNGRWPQFAVDEIARIELHATDGTTVSFPVSQVALYKDINLPPVE